MLALLNVFLILQGSSATAAATAGQRSAHTGGGSIIGFDHLPSFEGVLSTFPYTHIGVTEDFETGSLGADAEASLFDPLIGGEPNMNEWLFWGYPTGLHPENAHLQIQSNTLGGNPVAPSPRNPPNILDNEGLLALTPDWSNLGLTSDVVTTNFYADSMDIIFNGPHSIFAVGFDCIALPQGEVAIRVYNQSGDHIGTHNVIGSPANGSFGGVIATVPIGRVNIYAIAPISVESADNIQTWGLAVEGGCCVAGICEAQTETMCALQGGIYFGGDSACGDNPCTACPGDVDGGGAIDGFDLAIMLGAWGPNPGHPADLNGDDVVDATDLAILLGGWGPCE